MYNSLFRKVVGIFSVFKPKILYFDATGSIISQPNQVETNLVIFYYSLIIAGTLNSGPVAVAESFLSRHVFSIRWFLAYFNNALKQLSKSKIIKKI